MEPHDDFPFDDVCRRIDGEAQDEASAYRRAAEKSLRLVHAAIEFLHLLERPTVESVAILAAIGHPAMQGRRLATWAAQLGVSRALLSLRARQFARRAGIGPEASAYLRSPAYAAQARANRIRFLAQKIRTNATKRNENRTN
jgi:hypothetical protein